MRPLDSTSIVHGHTAHKLRHTYTNMISLQFYLQNTNHCSQILFIELDTSDPYSTTLTFVAIFSVVTSELGTLEGLTTFRLWLYIISLQVRFF